MRNKGGRLIDYVCNFREKPFVAFGGCFLNKPFRFLWVILLK